MKYYQGDALNRLDVIFNIKGKRMTYDENTN